MSDNITPFVAFFEGWRPAPYTDAGGRWTIGYGFRFLDGEVVGPKTRTMTEQEGLALLREQLHTTELLIQRDVGDLYLLEPWKWDALTSLVFNIGHVAWLQSTMLQRLRDKDLDGASREFPRWCHVNGVVVHGLIMRRYWERHLWADGYRAVKWLLDGLNPILDQPHEQAPM